MRKTGGKAQGFRVYEPIVPVDPTPGLADRMLAQQRLQADLSSSLANMPLPPQKMSADEQREWLERQLEASHATNTQVRELVDLTVANVALAQESQKTAAQSEQFSRRIAWTSVLISIASLVAAALAIVLQAIELQPL
jgi:predicted ribosome quality control (RQC) complex YloA/Tae2 family protein